MHEAENGRKEKTEQPTEGGCLELSRPGGTRKPRETGKKQDKQRGSACGDIHHVTGTKVWKYPDQTRPEPTVEGRKSVVGILQKRAVNRAKAELVGQYEEFTHAHTKRKNRRMNEGR